MNPRSLPAFSKAYRNGAAAALAALAVAVFVYELRGFSSVHAMLADFRAFYCAGSAVAHGADPYASAALSSCERFSAPWGLYTAPAHVVVPAPLPPYGLALFVPFALLRFPDAALLWFTITLVAVALSGYLLVRRFGLPAGAVACMLLLPATVLWLPFGEVTPIALLGAVVAGCTLQRRTRVAAFGLALLALEPHIGAGAWIAAMLFVPRVRAPLAIAGAVLIALSLLVRADALTEYVRDVLPLHALAELPRPSQYSAAWALYASGVSAGAALAAASAMYVVMCIVGVALGLALRARWREPAALIFAPVAACVFGGTFVHASQLALALPFAAMLALHEKHWPRVAGALACGVLSVPWLQGGSQQTVVLVGVAVAAYVVLSLSASRTLALRTLCAAAAFAALLVAGAHAPRIAHAHAFPVAARGEAFASAAWGDYVWKEQSAVSIADWLGKLPSWLALLALIGGAAWSAANKEPEPAIGVGEIPAVL